MKAVSRLQLGVLALLVSATVQARDAEPGTPQDREAFLAVVKACFPRWDADGSGVLEVAEINAQVVDPRVTGDEAAALAALKRATRSRRHQLPPLSHEGIEAVSHPKDEGDTASETDSETARLDLGAMFAGSRRRIAEAKRVLFGSGLPRLDTVRQGRMGNCFCLAPMGALVHRRPEWVAKEMIRALPDGRYAVRLGKEVWEVTAPTEAEIALMAGNSGDGLWINVYEKAAAEARNAGRAPEQREALALDLLNRGGSAGTQLAFITGHEMVRLSCKFAKDATLSAEEYAAKLEEIRTALSAATTEGRLMTCGTLQTSVPGITPNHAYAVLGYERESDLIEVWNPHGDTRSVPGEAGVENGYPLNKGVFKLPLTVFVKEFSGLAFEVLKEEPGAPEASRAPFE